MNVLTYAGLHTIADIEDRGKRPKPVYMFGKVSGDSGGHSALFHPLQVPYREQNSYQ